MTEGARRGIAGAGLLIVVVVAGCADTVNPALGGLKIGVQNAPLRPPERLDETHPFEFPTGAWSQGAGGTTVLKLLISAEGTVDSTFVLQSSGHPDLDSAAVANARRLLYRPARQGGQPVAIWGRLPVIYPLPGGVKPNEP